MVSSFRPYTGIEMQRKTFPVRENWKERCEAIGFDYCVFPDGHQYWQEGVGYHITPEEVDALEAATNDLHSMCVDLARDMVQKGDYPGYDLSLVATSLIEASFKAGEPSLYGRFDLAYHPERKEVKLLEYNADTPTMLLESSIAQWNWVEDHKLPDQFNSIHEKLVLWWKNNIPTGKRIYLTGMTGEDISLDDWGNINYLLDTAVQSGFDASWIALEHIGLENGKFVDVEDKPIETLFKLYPWEWLIKDNFAFSIQNAGTRFIEPAWKMLLSNKALLVKLWEKHPKHPYLLRAFFEHDAKTFQGDFIKKPLLAREGANVSRRKEGVESALEGSSTNTEYGKEGYVLQEWFDLPVFDGFRPIIGSWVIGGESAGIGIREDSKLVIGNSSFFAPHYFE